MMVIDNKFNIGDTVYLKTDKDQLPRIVFAIKVYRAEGFFYELASGTVTSVHCDFEVSTEPNVILTTTN